ncbi:MAG: hypothetical protein IJL91_01780 [Bacteroidales bacterium]|nr:hypothetical protein [Bacteroidales bacterium]
MKTRKATILLAGAAIACMAIVSGCSKSPIGLGGKAIQFTASGSSQTTKTEYGDDSGSKQALNWKTGDVITVASPQAPVQNDNTGNLHASNYVVTVKTTGVPSTGSVKNEGVNGLMWSDDDEIKAYDFYAIYPKAGNSISLVPATGLVTATIPASQPLNGTASDKVVGEGDAAITYKEYKPDMNFAFMTAATKGVTPTTVAASVKLTFDPAFTAFEFNVSSQDEDEIELTGFELSSPNDGENVKRNDKLAGQFTMTAGLFSSIAAASSATQSIKVDMSGAPQKIDEKHGLTFTVFALPVANKEPLRLRFTSKDGDNASKTSWLDLKYSDDEEKAGTNAGNPLVFEAGHKYRINMLKLPSSQWKITIVPMFDDWVPATEKVVIYI